jgi:outer membrane receptor protein involved in Fe transport
MLKLERGRLLASTVLGGFAATALMAGAAVAQDAPAATPAASSASSEEEIVVTGSRIPQPNITSVSPVTVVSNEEFKLSGTTRTEDLLNSLPQVFAGQGSQISNGSTGTATVDLRGLGSERTLVLINGRRLMPGDPNSSAADLNAVPSALIKRVDVLTGGASSTYGSDALGGVVNFVMDTDFEGFRLDGQYSFYQHDNDVDDDAPGLKAAYERRGFPYPKGSTVDGKTVDVTGIIGAGFDDDHGHVVAYFSYRSVDKITQDNRAYSACTTQARNPAQVAADPARLVDCGGSATSANGTFFDWNSNVYQIGSDRSFIGGNNVYNFAPTNYYQRPDERFSGGFFAEYEINDSIQPYLEGMFMDDRTVAQIAPSGNFGNTFSVNCDNPLLSAQQLAIVCAPDNLVTEVLPSGFPLVDPSQAPIDFNNSVPGAANATYNRGWLQPLRRNVEGGPRRDDLQHTSYRFVAGVKGDLSSAFSYDMYYMFGRTNYADTYLNDFSVTRLGRAMDVVTDPATGQAACRSALDGTDPNCVPWDIFAPGAVNADALDYLQTPAFQRGLTEEKVFNASLTGDLTEFGLKTPWAESGLAFAVGFEYRQEFLELNTDTAFQTNDLAGQGAPTLPSRGSFDVTEFFAEARIPIIENNVIDSLVIEGGYRHSKYEVAGGGSKSTDAYKIGIDIAPIQDVRLRASYNRAVRAANIQELFATQRVVLNGNSDPCAGIEITAADTGCLLTGLNVGDFVVGNSAGQYNGLVGGNPDLEPEVGDTFAIGIVLQPEFLEGFTATIDYFDIKIEDVIQGIGQDIILAQCVATANPAFCDLVIRDATGSLWRSSEGYVIDTPQNLGSLKTSGVDVSVDYNYEIDGAGTIGFNMVGTWLDNLSTDNGVSEPYDCTGYYGLSCGTPNPEWRHKARISFTTVDGMLSGSIAWRYFASVDIDLSSENPTLNGTYVEYNETIDSQSYFDITLTGRFEEHYTLNLGVMNVLDRAPPIIGSNGASAVINACSAVFCNGNTYPGVYDAMGRYVFAGLTVDF